MTLLLCVGAFLVGALVGALACGALVFRGVMALGRERIASALAKDGTAVLNGRVETEQVQARTPTMTSTWHPGASTN